MNNYLGEGTRTEVTPEMVEEMKKLGKDGHTYKEIAEEIEVAAPTVAKYMRKEGLGGKKKVTEEMVEEFDVCIAIEGLTGLKDTSNS